MLFEAKKYPTLYWQASIYPFTWQLGLKWNMFKPIVY